MQTDDLIELLAKDAKVRVRFAHVFLIALAIGLAVSTGLLLSTYGVRDNMADAIGTPRVQFKLGLTLLLALTSTRLAFLIGKPGISLRSAGLSLLWPLLLLLGGIATELIVLPQGAWEPSLKGQHWSFCLVFVPTLAAAPLAALLYSVRQGAPENPGLAGALAGLSAGGIAAAIYAWHCPDDSPLFVATWYTIAISMVTATGFLLGRRVLRW